MSFSWPGNVRELENAIIRAIHLSSAATVEVDDLGLESASSELPASGVTPPKPMRVLKRELVETFERGYLTRLMSEHSGNVSRAARAAGKERRDFGKLLKKYGLDVKLFQDLGCKSRDWVDGPTQLP
jgi:DNA-binding NtrC family response regulator